MHYLLFAAGEVGDAKCNATGRWDCCHVLQWRIEQGSLFPIFWMIVSGANQSVGSSLHWARPADLVVFFCPPIGQTTHCRGLTVPFNSTVEGWPRVTQYFNLLGDSN